MDAIQDYTLVTTIAIGLLVVSQLLFLLMVTILVFRINRIVKSVRQTSDMSRDFVRSLREEQLKRVPLWQLGLFAFKRAQVLRKK
jgi:hypothetical protein